MCVGSIMRLAEIIVEDGVALGRFDDGWVAPLSFVPRATVGDQLLLHLGIPVEVLDPEAAQEALCLRGAAAAAMCDPSPATPGGNRR